MPTICRWVCSEAVFVLAGVVFARARSFRARLAPRYIWVVSTDSWPNHREIHEPSIAPRQIVGLCRARGSATVQNGEVQVSTRHSPELGIVLPMPSSA